MARVTGPDAVGFIVNIHSRLFQSLIGFNV